jgi:hypothetical protein
VNTKTAAELRAEAAQHEQNAAESFDRCDTDGFVSQWASGINAQVARRQADIVENGGVWTFRRVRLADAETGEIVADARRVKTRYGLKWRIDSTDEWLPYEPARDSTLRKHGYVEVEEFATAPAKAKSWSPSNARGLSGATSVCVVIVRTDELPGGGREAAEWEPYSDVNAADLEG